MSRTCRVCELIDEHTSNAVPVTLDNGCHRTCALFLTLGSFLSFLPQASCTGISLLFVDALS